MLESDAVSQVFDLLKGIPRSQLPAIITHIQAILSDDFVTVLPRELSLHIFSFASVNTLLDLQRVSRQWNTLISDGILWRIKFQDQNWLLGKNYLKSMNRNPDGTLKSTFRDYEEEYCLLMDSNTSIPRHFSIERAEAFLHLSQAEREELIDGIGTGSLPRDFHSFHDDFANLSIDMIRRAPSPRHELPNDVLFNWKKVYKEKQLLERNWSRCAYFKSELLGHSEAIYCLQFDQDKIVSGSRDNSLKVWDIKSQICTQTLIGHSASVLCLEFDDEYIISGSSDCTMIVWSVVTGKQIRILVGHTESVLNIKFDRKFIVSCSKDKTIKIWETKTGKLLRTLKGHRAAVNAVQYKKDVIVSASGGLFNSSLFNLDRCINIWSLRTGEIIKTLTGHTRGIACIQYDGHTIVSGSSDETIRIWDAHTGKQLRVITAHSDLVRTLQFNQSIIVSGSYDSMIKVWSIKTGELLFELPGHDNRVFKIAFNQTKIVSCSQDMV